MPRPTVRPGAPIGCSITVGGKGALFELALALFEEGQEVVVHTPAWVSIPEQIRFAGAAVVEVPTSGADGFAVDPDAMLGAITRAHPRCDPQLAVQSDRRKDLPEAFTAIVEGCAARGVLVISDETYERFVYDGASPFRRLRSPPAIPRRSLSSVRSRRPTR